MDELADLLRQESHLHHPTLYPLHPRARLRCHPLVVNKLMQMFVMDELLKSEPALDDASRIMGILVTVDATMEPGTWVLIAGEGTI